PRLPALVPLLARPRSRQRARATRARGIERAACVAVRTVHSRPLRWRDERSLQQLPARDRSPRTPRPRFVGATRVGRGYRALDRNTDRCVHDRRWTNSSTLRGGTEPPDIDPTVDRE